jgi:hypothetical protein
VSRYSDWAMDWTTENLGFNFRQGQEIFFSLLHGVSSPVPGPAESPVQRVPGAPSPSVKRPEYEVCQAAP